MTAWIETTEQLPPLNKYVVVRLNKKNWIDDDDPVNVYTDVAKRIKSKQEGNNKRDYQWNTFGPARYFGQEVDHWFEIPPTMKSNK